MSILKVRSKEGEVNRQVGVEVLQPTYDYLTIYALVNGVTKTTIIRRLIGEWLEQQQSIDEIIKKLCRQLDIEYKAKRSRDPNVTRESYKREVVLWLERKGIGEDIIQLITEGLDGKD